MFKDHYPKNSPKLFDFYAPTNNDYKGIVSIPHSGLAIPNEFTPFLSGNQNAYQQDVDFFVPELIDMDKLRSIGLSIMVSNIHRIVVDLNRSEDIAVLAWKDNSHGVNLVAKEPSTQERQSLLAQYYHPYYEGLKAQLHELEKKMKKVPVVDLHSMPSKPTAYHMKQNPHQKSHRPDFCISNELSGANKTCSQEYIDHITKKLQSFGHEVFQNDPYKGGNITKWIGKNFNTEMIQIETNRNIYMDEKQFQLKEKESNLIKDHLTNALVDLFTQYGN